MIPALFAFAGLVVLALALAFAYPSAIVLGLGFLGAAFLAGLPSTGPLRAAAPLAGGWLLAVAELAYWSVDFKVAGRDDPRIHRRRAGMIAGLVAAGVLLSLVPEIDFNPGGLDGIELTALGVIGGGTLVALAAALAWRLRGPNAGRGSGASGLGSAAADGAGAAPGSGSGTHG
jgi:hypothetical protein